MGSKKINQFWKLNQGGINKKLQMWWLAHWTDHEQLVLAHIKFFNSLCCHTNQKKMTQRPLLTWEASSSGLHWSQGNVSSMQGRAPLQNILHMNCFSMQHKGDGTHQWGQSSTSFSSRYWGYHKRLRDSSEVIYFEASSSFPIQTGVLKCYTLCAQQTTENLLF